MDGATASEGEMPMTFRVVYLWRSERHSLLKTFKTQEEALLAAYALRADHWPAWVEENAR